MLTQEEGHWNTAGDLCDVLSYPSPTILPAHWYSGSLKDGRQCSWCGCLLLEEAEWTLFQRNRVCLFVLTGFSPKDWCKGLSFVSLNLELYQGREATERTFPKNIERQMNKLAPAWVKNNSWGKQQTHQNPGRKIPEVIFGEGRE